MVEELIREFRVSGNQDALVQAVGHGVVDYTEARAIVHAHPGIVEGLSPADRRSLTDEAWAANAPAVVRPAAAQNPAAMPRTRSASRPLPSHDGPQSHASNRPVRPASP